MTVNGNFELLRALFFINCGLQNKPTNGSQTCSLTPLIFSGNCRYRLRQKKKKL